MTAPAPPPAEPHPELVQILGEMAPRFGLSRPAGQCFAAIWRAAQAPSAEDLVRLLGLSRSNVSVALKELRAVGLVQVARSPGARRDFFVAEADPWVLVRVLAAERQRRDLLPLAARLEALDGSDPRLAPLAAMVSGVADWLGQIARTPAEDLARLMAASTEGKKKKKKRPKD